MTENNLLFPKGERAPVDYFTGVVWLNLIMPNDPSLNCQMGNVTFEAGARTNWHTHKGGQILIVTNGIGCYQEKGNPIQTLNKGDVVRILPDVLHWHGASPSSEFTHIAINPNTQEGAVIWLEPVTDEEYRS